MSSRRRLVVAAALVFALVALAGCTVPAPKEEVICHGCVQGIESVTDGSEAVDGSVTHVYLRERGAARIVARLDLADGAALNASAAEQIEAKLRAGDTERPDGRPAFDRRAIDVRPSESEAVVEYRVPNATERRFGVTLSDRFYRRDHQHQPDELDYGPYRIATDRVVVHGPEGTEPLVNVPDASERDDRVVWTGEAVPTTSYLAFGDGAGQLHARATLVVDVLGWAGPPAARGAALPIVLFGGLAVGFAYSYPRRVADGDWDPSDDGVFKYLVSLVLGGPLLLAAASLGSGPAYVSLSLFLIFALLLYLLYGGGSNDETDGEGGDEPNHWAAHFDEGRPDARDGRSTKRTTGDSAGRTDGISSDSADIPRPQVNEPFRQRLLDRVRPEPPTVEAAADAVRSAALVAAAAAPVVAVATLLVAADYRGSSTDLAATIAAGLSLSGFLTLGVFVTDRYRTVHRAAAVAAVAAGPWLLALAWTVGNGPGGASGALFLSTVAGAILGPLLFYAGLSLVTR